VLKSTDAGASWTSMKSGLGPSLANQAVFRLDLSPNSPQRLIVSVADTSYFLSDDGGATFSRPATSTLQNGIMQFDPGDASGLRIVSLSQSGTAVVESLDGGQTWHTLGPLPSAMLNNGTPAQPTGIRPSDIAISHQDPRVMYLSGSSGTVFRTGDRGATWARVLSGDRLPD
jgi:photosystem II stability/assembly factor-like uncharacterized protein